MNNISTMQSTIGTYIFAFVLFMLDLLSINILHQQLSYGLLSLLCVNFAAGRNDALTYWIFILVSLELFILTGYVESGILLSLPLWVVSLLLLKFIAIGPQAIANLLFLTGYLGQCLIAGQSILHLYDGYTFFTICANILIINLIVKKLIKVA